MLHKQDHQRAVDERTCMAYFPDVIIRANLTIECGQVTLQLDLSSTLSHLLSQYLLKFPLFISKTTHGQVIKLKQARLLQARQRNPIEPNLFVGRQDRFSL